MHKKLHLEYSQRRNLNLNWNNRYVYRTIFAQKFASKPAEKRKEKKKNSLLRYSYFNEALIAQQIGRRSQLFQQKKKQWRNVEEMPEGNKKKGTRRNSMAEYTNNVLLVVLLAAHKTAFVWVDTKNVLRNKYGHQCEIHRKVPWAGKMYWRMIEGNGHMIIVMRNITSRPFCCLAV